MPFVSQAQRKFLFAKHPRVAKEFASKTPKGAKLPEHVMKKSKKKSRMKVDNHLKGSYGETTISKNKTVIKINVKKHKGNKAELADTIKHELLHAKHPKMHEKTVRKLTAAPMSKGEQARLLLKFREGKLRKKMNIGRDVAVAPGDLINKAKSMSTRKVGALGLI